MAEEFEVKGAHEEEVEHRAEHREPLSQRIALFSAVLATIGAVVSLLGGHTENDALYQKNEAVLLKARASDSWEHFQAEEIKRHLLEATAPLTHDEAAMARLAATASSASKASGSERVMFRSSPTNRPRSRSRFRVRRPS